MYELLAWSCPVLNSTSHNLVSVDKNYTLRAWQFHAQVAVMWDGIKSV
uniref:Uncharacterized protein n=1 Tax=Arundo donax TaxID=35708 RepID=A0A0A8XRI5_ARUDO